MRELLRKIQDFPFTYFEVINLEKLFDLIYQQTVNRWGYYEKPKFGASFGDFEK